MFGKNKTAILTTTLIVKVRKYKNNQPYFSLYNPPSMANEENARDVVEKLNAVEKYNTEDSQFFILLKDAPLSGNRLRRKNANGKKISPIK